jgi:acetoin utilization protein AcuB
MLNLTVERFMTPTPHTVGHDQTLATAHQLMRQHGIRHLPVLEAGKVVGMVSQRDLYLIESLQDVDPNIVQVNEAMTMELYCVEPRTPLRELVAEMVEQKRGSAVVVERENAVGIFTTTDALEALYAVLDPQS